MQVVELTADYTKRTCSVCDEVEYLPRAGKITSGYNLQAESFRDFERRKYAKDLLQPQDRKGNLDPLFKHAWGNPYKKSKMGSKVDQYRVKDE